MVLFLIYWYIYFLMKPLLKTKWLAPKIRLDGVQRVRLLQRLNSGLEQRLILIAAPAGFGKTTLVSSFVQQVTFPTVWLSLDKNDNELTQFTHYLLSALQQTIPKIGHLAASLLATAPDLDLDDIVTSLANDALAYGERFALVLDDYHVIENQSVHELIRALLRSMPSEMHLILISRADPPLSLARLRARNELCELRIDDLRFDLNEAASFLHQTMGFALSTDDIEAITQRTEGWIAGLQLAALSLQELPLEERHHFVLELAGDDRYIFDYLLEEVLQFQPETIQTFLIQTSILASLNASLCNAVTQRNDGQSVLQWLEKRNLFISPQNNRRSWYRYHQLFADLLQYRLLELTPDIVATLHLRASDWYEENGMIELAVEHALDAQDYERASLLIEQYVHQIFGQGKLQRVVLWFNVLPDNLLYVRPKLYLTQGWIFFRQGEFEKLEAHVLNPSLDNSRETSESMRGEYLILKAHVSFLQGHFDHAITLLQKGLVCVSVDDFALRMPATSIMGWSYEANEDLDKAIHWFEQGLHMARQVDSLTGTISTLGCLVGAYATQGAFDRATVMFREVMQYAKAHGSEQLPLLGLAYIGMGRVLQVQKKWDSAAEHLQRGISLCRRWGGLSIVTMKGFAALADVCDAQGKVTLANSIRVEAQNFGREQRTPQWAMSVLDSQIHMASHLPEPLTRREREVLRLLLRGLSSIEIADELIVGVSTVRTHIKRIYSKLDVHNRHEVIARARQLGFG